MSYAQFHPEPAAHLINDENGGKALQDENVYNEYLNQLKNIGHSVGFELKAGPVSRKMCIRDSVNPARPTMPASRLCLIFSSSRPPIRSSAP